jgi:hypothetical protein
MRRAGASDGAADTVRAGSVCLLEINIRSLTRMALPVCGAKRQRQFRLHEGK